MQSKVVSLTKCRQTLVLLSQSGNAGGESSTSSFYEGLIELNCDAVLGEAMGFDDSQLIPKNIRAKIFA